MSGPSPPQKAPDALTFRPIEPADHEFLYRLYASTRAEELAAGTDWTDEQKEAFLRQQFEAQHHHYQTYYPEGSFDLVVLDGEPIGRLYVSRWQCEIRLIDIALVPEVRNRGIGGGLLGGLMEEARQAGKPLTIHVETFNPAMRLYERLGFTTLEDKGVYHLMEWRPSP
jgi:GNAT superfamily N-acetyltransferase